MHGAAELSSPLRRWTGRQTAPTRTWRPGRALRRFYFGGGDQARVKYSFHIDDERVPLPAHCHAGTSLHRPDEKALTQGGLGLIN